MPDPTSLKLLVQYLVACMGPIDPENAHTVVLNASARLTTRVALATAWAFQLPTPIVKADMVRNFARWHKDFHVYLATA